MRQFCYWCDLMMRKGWFFSSGELLVKHKAKNPHWLSGDSWQKRRWRYCSSRSQMMGGQVVQYYKPLTHAWRSKGDERSGRNKPWLKSMFLKEQWREKLLWCFALITEHTAVTGVNWGLGRNTVWEDTNFLSYMNLSQAAGSQVVLRHPGSS